VLSQGSYQESFIHREMDLHFSQSTLASYVQYQFGQYVVLKGYFNYFIRDYSFHSTQDQGSTKETPFSFVTVLEFLL